MVQLDFEWIVTYDNATSDVTTQATLEISWLHSRKSLGPPDDRLLLLGVRCAPLLPPPTLSTNRGRPLSSKPSVLFNTASAAATFSNSTNANLTEMKVDKLTTVPGHS